MKKLVIILVLGTLAAGHVQATTAYEALGVLKKARGEAVLKQLVEVRGETGQPQPPSWTILMNDPLTRGGIREFVVSGGEIASERTPVRSYDVGANASSVLNFSRLNVDSDSAFKIANAQAANLKIGFHTVDYTLRTNNADGAPMWVLHLFDYMGAPVGSLRVSAENAKIVRALQVDPDARQKPVVSSPPPKVKTTPVARATPEPTPVFKGGVFGFVERTSKKVGRTVKKTTLNVAGSVQEVLTGDRTIDDNSDNR